MNQSIRDAILLQINADALFKIDTVQSLWSAYGEIARYRLARGRSDGRDGGNEDDQSIIVKHVKLPEQHAHPRGWNTDRSHQRKVRSYQVESHWYSNYSALCDESCLVPQCYFAEASDHEYVMVLEDLDAAGFSVRHQQIDLERMRQCLAWLAHFHVRFIDEPVEGLWPTGTYWHLETRPDELEALDDLPLKQAASEIDQRLKNAPFQTLVHGDAKLANFCFADDGQSVAAVDFQYVGRGCGMKDVAYFIGSCLRERDCERYEQELLAMYFAEIKQAIAHFGKSIDPAALEAAWRPMYPIAWTDFHRFVKGWSPGHWKIHSYSERLAREMIQKMASRTNEAP